MVSRNEKVFLTISLIAVALVLGFNSTSENGGFQSATQQDVSDITNFSKYSLNSLSATEECSGTDYNNCYFNSKSFGDAYAHAIISFENLQYIDSNSERFLVKESTDVAYECEGTDAWVSEYDSSPTFDYSSTGITADYTSIDLQGSLSLDEYDGNQGLMLLCGDHDKADNGDWSATTVWSYWGKTVEVNKPPEITGVSVPSNVVTGEEYVFSAAVSDPNSDQDVSVSWSNGDSGSNASFSWSEPGKKSVAVEASDGFLQDNLAFNVVVEEQNVVPVIDSLSVPESVESGETFTTSVSASDENNDDLSYSWSNGDSGVNASYRFLESGTYNVSVTVSDGEVSVSDSRMVQVVESSESEGGSGFWSGLLDFFGSFF